MSAGAEVRSFEIPGALQVVLALAAQEVADELRAQKEHREPILCPGAAKPTPFVSLEESDFRIEMCMAFVRSVWDGGAADLLSRGMI